MAYLTDTKGDLSSPVGSTFLCLMWTSYCMRATQGVDHENALGGGGRRGGGKRDDQGARVTNGTERYGNPE